MRSTGGGALNRPVSRGVERAEDIGEHRLVCLEAELAHAACELVLRDDAVAVLVQCSEEIAHLWMWMVVWVGGQGGVRPVRRG